MTKKIVAVNAGPRKGWNTDTLIGEAAKGAESAGAEIEKFDLFRLEKFSGCVSCFGCKKNAHKGTCIIKDGLTPVLEAIRCSDGLIIGSPNYLSGPTAAFRALYERLIFQHLTYRTEDPIFNERRIPVLFIMTCNVEADYYSGLVEEYRGMFERAIGPADAFICGNTLQVRDYGKLDWEWTYFDTEEKMRRHETVFPEECRTAFEKGAELAR